MKETRFHPNRLFLATNFRSRPSWRTVLRSSAFRIICGLRLLTVPPRGGLKTHRPGEMGKLADPRNIVDPVPVPWFSRFARLPASRARGQATSKRCRSTILKAIELHGPVSDLNVHGAPPMAMTATERSRVLRERCAAGKAVLTVVVGEDELAGRIRRGSLDGSQGAGSGRRLVPGRHVLGAHAMTLGRPATTLPQVT
jgi:hypothetical protein